MTPGKSGFAATRAAKVRSAREARAPASDEPNSRLAHLECTHITTSLHAIMPGGPTEFLTYAAGGASSPRLPLEATRDDDTDTERREHRGRSPSRGRIARQGRNRGAAAVGGADAQVTVRDVRVAGGLLCELLRVEHAVTVGIAGPSGRGVTLGH